MAGSSKVPSCSQSANASARPPPGPLKKHYTAVGEQRRRRDATPISAVRKTHDASAAPPPTAAQAHTCPAGRLVSPCLTRFSGLDWPRASSPRLGSTVQWCVGAALHWYSVRSRTPYQNHDDPPDWWPNCVKPMWARYTEEEFADLQEAPSDLDQVVTESTPSASGASDEFQYEDEASGVEFGGVVVSATTAKYRT